MRRACRDLPGIGFVGVSRVLAMRTITNLICILISNRNTADATRDSLARQSHYQFYNENFGHKADGKKILEKSFTKPNIYARMHLR